MDVAVTELRANLRHWLQRAGGGEEVVITDRGRPVARLLAPGATTLLEDLEARGVISRPKSPKRLDVLDHPMVKAKGDVLASDVVSQLRD